MHLSRWARSTDTRWYLGVNCRKCRTPILFGLDHTGGETEAPPAPIGRLVLTCPEDGCGHQADYSNAKVSRFQKTAAAAQ